MIKVKKSYNSESSQKAKKNDIKKSAQIIIQSNKSVIIAGGGIKYTSKYKEVIKLAELLNIPMVTTAGHGDAIPFNHKLNAGQMGPTRKSSCIKTWLKKLMLLLL